QCQRTGASAQVPGSQSVPFGNFLSSDGRRRKSAGRYPGGPGGLVFPKSGYVRPAVLCESLLNAAHVAVRTQHIEELRYDAIQQSWQLLGSGQEILDQAPVVILATASASLKFSQAQGLPLKSIRGQITLCPQPKDTALNSVICGEGYVSPPRNGDRKSV